MPSPSFGNLCESCIDNYLDNYLVNFMGYTRLYPLPDSAQRDKSSFFGPDQGIDGVFEEPAAQRSTPAYPAHYSGIPLSLGPVLDELGIEIAGVEVPRQITNAIRPFGSIPAAFSPVTGKPPTYPRFVVMEAKFVFHAKAGQTLSDDEWQGRLGTTQGGRQMSRTWINTRLTSIFPVQSNGTAHPKRIEMQRNPYARWLYGCQPHKATNSKLAQPRNGKRRLANLAFFPPYAIKGFDLDAMGWKI